MDDRYQLPSATNLSLPAKISPEIRATIFYPVSTDASSPRSKPVLFAIRSSAFFLFRFQTIEEKFPNLRVRGRIPWSENIISPDIYGPLLSHSSFYLRIAAHRSILVYFALPSSVLGMKYEDINTISNSSRAFRFGFRAVLVNFIFVHRFTRSGTRNDQSQSDGKKTIALRKIRFDSIEGIRICPKIKKLSVSRKNLDRAYLGIKF